MALHNLPRMNPPVGRSRGAAKQLQTKIDPGGTGRTSRNLPGMQTVTVMRGEPSHVAKLSRDSRPVPPGDHGGVPVKKNAPRGAGKGMNSNKGYF